MTLVRTTLLSALAVAVRIASALAVNKLLAVLVGPGGYALIGQLQSLVSMLGGIAGGLLGNAVIKDTAQHFDDELRQQATWRSAIHVALYLAAALALALLAARHELALWLFQRDDLADVFVWCAALLPAIAVNMVLLAILAGKKDVSGYVWATVFSSAAGLGITALLAATLEVRGALIAVALVPAVSILASAGLISRKPWFGGRHLWGSADRAALGGLAKLGLMTLAAATCTPLAHLLIRKHLAQDLGWSAAGYWHGVTRMSDIYLTVITMVLSLYFLPRVAEMRSAAGLRAEIAKVCALAIPVAAAAALLIYLARDALVSLLFTAQFAPMGALFGWQLAGDVVRAASWIFAYVLLGRGAIVPFVSTEIAFSALLVVLTWLLTEAWGLVGAPMAHFANHVLYLAALAFFVRRLLRA